MGAAIIIIILLLAPIGILLSSTAFAAIFTGFLNHHSAETHKDTELGVLAETGVAIATDH